MLIVFDENSNYEEFREYRSSLKGKAIPVVNLTTISNDEDPKYVLGWAKNRLSTEHSESKPFEHF
jgi:hypothetical protein